MGSGWGRGEGRVWGGVRVDVNEELKFYVKIKENGGVGVGSGGSGDGVGLWGGSGWM